MIYRSCYSLVRAFLQFLLFSISIYFLSVSLFGISKYSNIVLFACGIFLPFFVFIAFHGDTSEDAFVREMQYVTILMTEILTTGDLYMSLIHTLGFFENGSVKSSITKATAALGSQKLDNAKALKALDIIENEFKGIAPVMLHRLILNCEDLSEFSHSIELMQRNRIKEQTDKKNAFMIVELFEFIIMLALFVASKGFLGGQIIKPSTMNCEIITCLLVGMIAIFSFTFFITAPNLKKYTQMEREFYGWTLMISIMSKDKNVESIISDYYDDSPMSMKPYLRSFIETMRKPARDLNKTLIFMSFMSAFRFTNSMDIMMRLYAGLPILSLIMAG